MSDHQRMQVCVVLLAAAALLLAILAYGLFVMRPDPAPQPRVLCGCVWQPLCDGGRL